MWTDADMNVYTVSVPFMKRHLHRRPGLVGMAEAQGQKHIQLVEGSSQSLGCAACAVAFPYHLAQDLLVLRHGRSFASLVVSPCLSYDLLRLQDLLPRPSPVRL